LKQAFSWPGIVAALAGLVLMATGAGPAAAAQPQPWEITLQPAGSPIMEMIHSFNNATLIIISIIVLFVLVLLVIVMVRFNAKRNPVPSKTSHNTLIEVAWTVVPILILVGIAVPSFSLLIAQHDPARALPNYDPEKTLTIKATGSQWYWTYTYPDHEGVEFDSLMLTEEEITDPATQPRLLAVDHPVVVPVGTVVDMQVIGADVIHSFTVPSLGFKIDAIPGRLNSTWFLVEREGIYYGQCSELCGRDHAFMPIELRAVSQEKFDAWLTAAADDIDTSYAVLDGDAPEAESPEGAPAPEAGE
jgi:cytochrome c oxidase subunit 2